MKTLLTLLLILIIPIIHLVGQEKIFIEKSSVEDIIFLEQELNPNIVLLKQKSRPAKSFYPLADKYITTEYPIVILRESVDYLPLYAEYYYTAEDSIIRLTVYDWEKDRYDNLFKRMEIWKEESPKFESYNNEYMRVYSLLVNLLGEPISKDEVAKDQKGNNNMNLKIRDAVWETEDYYASLNMIFGGQTFRVRFKHYWKN